jgi:hypothetical protein
VVDSKETAEFRTVDIHNPRSADVSLHDYQHNKVSIKAGDTVRGVKLRPSDVVRFQKIEGAAKQRGERFLEITPSGSGDNPYPLPEGKPPRGNKQ